MINAFKEVWAENYPVVMDAVGRVLAYGLLTVLSVVMVCGACFILIFGMKIFIMDRFLLKGRKIEGQ